MKNTIEYKATHWAYIILYFVLLTLLGGCGSLSIKKDVYSTNTNFPKKTSYSAKQVNSLLKQQLKTWRTVPYRLGGISKRGIDCSGFVYVTFKNKLGVRLPRTTARLQYIGKNIKRNQLAVGDLVFFKTSYKVRHVGIYMGNKNFIHASTSKGVMLSSLDSVYWKKKYWMSKRVLDF